MAEKNTPPAEDANALRERLAALEAENARLKALAGEGRLSDEMEADVRWRMEAGLSRPMAIEAARAQLAWDKQQAAEAQRAREEAESKAEDETAAKAAKARK